MKVLIRLFVIAAAIAGAAIAYVLWQSFMWWQWHGELRELGMAVSEAINEPNGGDYARAVAIRRASDFHPAAKRYDIGQLIVGSFERPGSRRPPETLQQGLETIEQTAAEPGDMQEYVPQQLRMLFERGLGTPPNAIPIDRVVAECWYKLERDEPGDPKKCVALRRQRLPQLSA